MVLKATKKKEKKIIIVTFESNKSSIISFVYFFFIFLGYETEILGYQIDEKNVGGKQMSEMKLHRGTAILVKRQENETLEDVCKMICDKESYQIDSSYRSYKELLLDEDYEKYIEVKGELYQLIDKELDCNSGINEFIKNEDGTYSYIAQFYNGGADFTEVIEDGLVKVLENE